jgi:hypothetical protein
MTIDKTWLPHGFSNFSPSVLLARLKNAVTFEIPVGYQDETGFHAGVKADENEIKWPATW